MDNQTPNGIEKVLRDSADKFHKVLSALAAKRLVASEGAKMPTPMYEGMIKKYMSPEEMEQVLSDGFQACVMALVEMGDQDVSADECSPSDVSGIQTLDTLDYSDMAKMMLRKAYAVGQLAPWIGESIGRVGVLVAMIDVDGAVEIDANNRATAPNAIRDNSMIVQMANLLSENMKDMMLKAGKEAKKGEA